MKDSKNKNLKKNATDTKEIKTALFNLAIKSNEEKNKNEILRQQILFRQKQINENKILLSFLSSIFNKSDNKYKKEIENELVNGNQKIFESNKSIKKDINALNKKNETYLKKLDNNISQKKYILEAIKETNFILENEIKEKDNLISRLKEIVFDLLLNMNNFEIIKSIDKDLCRNIDEHDRTIDYNLTIDRDYYHQYLLYKATKFNKVKNKTFELTKKKNELENIINGYIHPNQNLSNKNNYIINNNNKSEQRIEYEKNKYKFNSSNDIVIPTNITTEGSIYSFNDSLYFDTEEQIDIELPENDFSSYYLSQKSLGFNIIKKQLVVPKLELKQIKYNLNRNYNSSKEISLSRSFENDLKHKIKKIKKQIKSYERQNDNLDKKCEKYEKKIKQIALFLYFNEKSN